MTQFFFSIVLLIFPTQEKQLSHKSFSICFIPQAGEIHLKTICQCFDVAFHKTSQQGKSVSKVNKTRRLMNMHKLLTFPSRNNADKYRPTFFAGGTMHPISATCIRSPEIAARLGEGRIAASRRDYEIDRIHPSSWKPTICICAQLICISCNFQLKADLRT